MTEAELLALPMADTFVSVRGTSHKRFVDYTEATDMWWYGEKPRDSKIKWYRVIVIREPDDGQTTDSGKQES